MRKCFVVVLGAVLLLLFAACESRPSFLTDIEIVSAPYMRWDVKTDYSGLTPYEPLHVMHSRLRAGALPELVPSGDYGMLMPYTGAYVISNFGFIQGAKFGFVTRDGIIVTDAVYDSISRAYDYSYNNEIMPRPAYLLSINYDGADSRWYMEMRYAVCALDGSWITSFDYIQVMFTSDAILLIRNYSTFDIDVLDYDGRLLYNMRDHIWIHNVNEDLMQFGLTHHASGGYTILHMNDGTVAFIDVLTGEARHTEFTGAGTFSEEVEGLAAVQVGDSKSGEQLWGYVNKDLELVIPPGYVYESRFINGRAVVETPDGVQRIINTRGETLLSFSGGWISRNHDDSGGYTVYDNNTGRTWHYTNDLIEIKPNSLLGELVDVYYLGGGWYIGECYEEVRWHEAYRAYTGLGYIGTVLFSADGEHLFADGEIWHIIQIAEEYVLYTRQVEIGGSGREEPRYEYRQGIMTLDGREIISPELAASITIAKDGDTVMAFAVNTGSSMFSLIGTDGGVISSGGGRLSYDETIGLYTVLSDDAFSFLDRDGKVIISIPLMSYLMD